MHIRDKVQDTQSEETTKNLTIMQVIGSILASFYGVQSSRNRKRDFQSGKARTFIVTGIFLTAAWYFTIYLVVTLVLQLTR